MWRTECQKKNNLLGGRTVQKSCRHYFRQNSISVVQNVTMQSSYQLLVFPARLNAKLRPRLLLLWHLWSHMSHYYMWLMWFISPSCCLSNTSFTFLIYNECAKDKSTSVWQMWYVTNVLLLTFIRLSRFSIAIKCNSFKHETTHICKHSALSKNWIVSLQGARLRKYENMTVIKKVLFINNIKL